MKKVLTILAFCSSQVFAATPHCDQFVPFGYPTVTQSSTKPLCRIAYFVLQDTKLRTPVYSVEWLLPENISGGNPRINAFKNDPDLRADEQANSRYFIGTDYDKGHLAPVEDMRTDSVAMMQSFYMSNIVPQYNKMNRGVWKSLEDATRKKAVTYNGMYVFTGPIYASDAKPSGFNIPTHLYKVLITKDSTKNNVGVGYIIPNVDVTGSKYVSFAVPISNVEQMTGLNFTPKLTPQQSKFKTVIDKGLK